MSELKVKFPEKLLFLFRPARYKVARGGRGSSKSWSFARALLLKGIDQPLRILCAREIQKNIKDSVHQLLSDQIVALGITSKYSIGREEIVSPNGTKIVFAGLSDLTVDGIKSFEGIDVCWVEEAQTITERSWKILIPTIRKVYPGETLPEMDKLGLEMADKLRKSEVWVSFNPDLESDPTYQRFVANPPDDCISVEVNWRDNPWWNEVLEAERQDCMRRFPKDYDNVWEGKCRPAVEGAIFFDEVAAMEREGRVCNVPYDPMLKVHLVFDLGVGGNMALSLVQKHASEIRIIDYLSGDEFPTLAHYSSELRLRRGYNWGKAWLPFADGFSADFKTGIGADKILQNLGWNVAKKDEVANADVEDGIRQARLVAGRVYIDKTRCAQYLESLRRYRRRINRQTMTATVPLPDDHAHVGDNFRYIAVNIGNMTNDTERKPMPRNVASYTALDSAVGY
ncbi:MAG: PBSX family phage terminase large subunit [Candidatus Binatia bacterium]|nr:PBSX family phage terminase large subunit [Candidatus Binatia bacterium]